MDEGRSDTIHRVAPAEGASLRDLLKFVETGVGSLPKVQHRRVLVDLRGLSLGPAEGAILSHHAGMLTHGVEGARIAVLVRKRTGQGQQIARRQGADLRVFAADEEDFALEWLGEP